MNQYHRVKVGDRMDGMDGMDGWRFSDTWCCFHQELPGVLGPFRGGILGHGNYIMILGGFYVPRNAGRSLDFVHFVGFLIALWGKKPPFLRFHGMMLLTPY